MKRNINRNLFNFEDLLNHFNYSQNFEKLFKLNDIFLRMELDKKLLMFEFEDNDVEALQLIDSIELQQYYVGKNIETLKDVLIVQESKLFCQLIFFGTSTLIGIN